MRKTAAAIATAVLAATTLTPSSAGAQTPEEALSQVSCGTVGPPLCDPVDQVLTLLAPLQPLLEVAGPALGELGAAANQLTALLEAGPDLPPKEVADAAASLLDQLDLLTGGLLDLLRGAGLDVAPLHGALSQLRELALTPLAPARGATPAPAASAGPAAGPTQTSASASAPTSFSSPVSSGAPLNSPAVPDVPLGSTLQLGPLTLPPFSFSTTPAVTAEELVAEQAATELIAPAVAAAVAPGDDDSSGRATAIVLAMSLLMLAVGLLLDQAHKVRQPIEL
jgi:hypothetical protein